MSKGFKRLTIAGVGLFAAYCAAWAVFGINSSSNYDEYIGYAAEALETKDAADFRHYGMLADKAAANVEMAINFGFYIPVALLALLAIGWWVYRGFRPKGQSEIA